MSSLPKTGDRVTWKTPRGETPGTVEKIVTRTTRVKGHIAKATRSKPEVMVKSSKTGQTAIHKPESLKQD